MGDNRSEKRVFPMNAIRVCVDTVEENQSGRVYSKLSDRPLVFRDWAELLLRADKLFDACGYPQTFQEKKSFREETAPKIGYRVPVAKTEDSVIYAQTGEVVTFDIIVESRRRVGWQGRLAAPDGSRMEYRSEIELLQKIYEVMKDLKQE